MDRCVTCQYYDRQPRGAEKSATAGQCRRAAPALSPINQKSYMIEGVWPTVRDDDWCGEWKGQARRADPARLVDTLSAGKAPALPIGAPRVAGVGMLPPRASAPDPLAALVPGPASRGND